MIAARINSCRCRAGTRQRPLPQHVAKGLAKGPVVVTGNPLQKLAVARFVFINSRQPEPVSSYGAVDSPGLGFRLHRLPPSAAAPSVEVMSL